MVNPPIDLRRQLWRAPVDDGGVLIDPPLEASAAWIEERRVALAASPCQIAGKPLRELAADARRELLAAARAHTSRYSDVERPPAALSQDPALVLAGHQPQLFHLGVWFKNAVLGSVAHTKRAVAVNVLVDNDVLKAPSIRVPGDSRENPMAEAVAFDAAGDEIPYEERRILDRDAFASFGRRARERIRPLVSEPLVARWWDTVVACARIDPHIGFALAAARHRFELSQGNPTLEVPLSALCRGEAFRWFAAALLDDASRLRDGYNQAVLEYRRQYRVRSRQHPVPLLEQRDDWVETPFWLWTAQEPRRRRAYVRRQGRELLLFDQKGLEIPLGASMSARCESLQAAEDRGVNIRPRALVTTMFLRLLASDLFVHGLGGALYDQVTDRLIRDVLGAEPPPFVVCTATMRLPVGGHSPSEAGLRGVQSQQRELKYHPERFLPSGSSAEVESLVAEKALWISRPQTCDNARTRAQSIARVNAALQPWLATAYRESESRTAALVSRRRAAAVLESRDYAFCLFPENYWHKLLASVPRIS